MDVKYSQLMRCIFCYVNPFLIINAKTQATKGLILYSPTNGIIALKKHDYANHCMIAKIFEEEVNNLLKEPHERKPTKKIPHVNGIDNSNFLYLKILIRKMMCSTSIFWKI
jgi:hypothetical protein